MKGRRVRRILMTADTVGGVWTYAIELAGALGRQGIRVELATMGAPLAPDQRAQAGRLSHLGIHESRFRLEWMQDPWEDVERAGEWLLELERALRPEVVHLNGYVHAALSWQAPRLVVGHSCVLSWWQAVRGGEAPGEWVRYREAVMRGLRAADLVTAPTRAMLAALALHYGPLPCARVIPNGRSPEAFDPASKGELIFTAGRLWDEAKNLGAVARAADGWEWPTYVGGEARHPEGGEASAPNLHLLGRLSAGQMAEWLGRAAIFVLPARYEPFGLSALEAGLAGCALVLGDIASLREVWGEAACFVPPDDTDALRQTVRELTRDPRARDHFGSQARARALQFGADKMAATYLSVYQLLLNQRAEKGAIEAPVSA